MVIFHKYLILSILLYIVHCVVSYPKQGQISGKVKNRAYVIQKLPKTISVSKPNNSSYGLKSGNGYNISKNIKNKSETAKKLVITEQDAKLKHSKNKNDIKMSNTRQNPRINDKRNGDDISGDINMDDEYIEGEINVPDLSDNQQNGDDIPGDIDIANDANNEGEINPPDQSEDFNRENSGNIIEGPNQEIEDAGEDQGHYSDTIVGDIELGEDGSIEGTLNEPDDEVDLQNPEKSNNNDINVGSNEAIVGSIEIDDNGSMEGELNVPDIENNSQAGKGYLSTEAQGDNGQSPNGDIPGDISGDIEIDDAGNIEGYIDLDDDGNNDSPSINSPQEAQEPHERPVPPSNQLDEKNCWLNLNSRQYLKELDEIDEKYNKARRQYQDEIGPEFDKQMMEVLMRAQGKAPRAVHQAHGNPNVIPAGLNLGGFGMMRMPGSMLFFHRMKLRNSTVFRVDYLQANLVDMTLVANLSLNDLHLRGSYERATTEENIAFLYFKPTYGELDVLIKAADYKMEGRLRMLNSRLMVELINSGIDTSNILISYANSSATAKEIGYHNFEDFIERMKSDIDIWLKDYFNDYLMYFGIVGGGKNSEIQLYEKQKTIKANEYADHGLKGIKQKIRAIKSANVRLPSFTLMSVLNHRIELKNGVLRGLDSIYRRSVAMTKKEKNIRTLDMIVGFSNLKVEYQYEASVIRGSPLLTGLLVLTADELTARLQLSQVADSHTVDINIDSIMQMKSESLTVEGPANRLIADFKYILENPIIAIMTNVMKHNVKMLKTLARCEPNLWGENNEYTPIDNDDIFQKPNNITPNKEDKGKSKGIVDAFSDENQKPIDVVNLKKEWPDYTFSKNDSVEIEVPVNGNTEIMKLSRNENFILSKVP